MESGNAWNESALVEGLKILNRDPLDGLDVAQRVHRQGVVTVHQLLEHVARQRVGACRPLPDRILNPLLCQIESLLVPPRLEKDLFDQRHGRPEVAGQSAATDHERLSAGTDGDAGTEEIDLLLELLRGLAPRSFRHGLSEEICDACLRGRLEQVPTPQPQGELHDRYLVIFDDEDLEAVREGATCDGRRSQHGGHTKRRLHRSVEDARSRRFRRAALHGELGLGTLNDRLDDNFRAIGTLQREFGRTAGYKTRRHVGAILDIALVHPHDVAEGDRECTLEFLFEVSGGGRKDIVLSQLEGFTEHARQAAVEPRLVLGLHPLQLRGRDTLFKSLERLRDAVERGIEIDPGIGPDPQRELTRKLRLTAAREGRWRQLFLLHDDLVERRLFSVRQEIRQDLERVGVVVVDRHRGPNQPKLRDTREVVLVEQANGRSQRRHRRRDLRQGSRRNPTEVLVDPHLRLLDVDVPGNDQRCVVGAVPSPVEILYVGEGRGVEIRKRTDHLPAVGVLGRVQRLVDHKRRVSVRLVVDPLPFLVLDDLPLLRDHRLGHRIDEKPELVRLGPKRLLERVVGHDLEVVGPVRVGGTVGRASHASHEPVQPAGA